jgi:hypothetical protein
MSSGTSIPFSCRVRSSCVAHSVCTVSMKSDSVARSLPMWMSLSITMELALGKRVRSGHKLRSSVVRWPWGEKDTISLLNAHISDGRVFANVYCRQSAGPELRVCHSKHDHTNVLEVDTAASLGKNYQHTFLTITNIVRHTCSSIRNLTQVSMATL